MSHRVIRTLASSVDEAGEDSHSPRTTEAVSAQTCSLMQRLVVVPIWEIDDRAIVAQHRRRATIWVMHHGHVPARSRWAWRGLAVVHAALVEAVVTEQAVRILRRCRDWAQRKTVSVGLAEVPRVQDAPTVV